MSTAMTPEAVEEARVSGLTASETRRAMDHLRGMVGPVHHIDPTAKVHPTAVIWHYSVVLAEATIAEGVSIGSHCEIGRGCAIGRETRIGKGSFLPPHTVVGERVFIGPQVTMCDDRHPRVHPKGHPPYFSEPPFIEDDAVIGAGAVLLPGVHVGRCARIGAGAVVTQDVPEHGFVRGEPAREKALSEAAKERW